VTARTLDLDPLQITGRTDGKKRHGARCIHHFPSTAHCGCTVSEDIPHHQKWWKPASWIWVRDLDLFPKQAAVPCRSFTAELSLSVLQHPWDMLFSYMHYDRLLEMGAGIPARCCRCVRLKSKGARLVCVCLSMLCC